MNLEKNLFAVKNEKGEWFTNTWSQSSFRFQDAKLYDSIGPARARVTRFTRDGSFHTVPEIVVLKTEYVETLNETKRVNEVLGR